jgi:hypothetical protein
VPRDVIACEITGKVTAARAALFEFGRRRSDAW